MDLLASAVPTEMFCLSIQHLLFFFPPLLTGKQVISRVVQMKNAGDGKLRGNMADDKCDNGQQHENTFFESTDLKHAEQQTLINPSPAQISEQTLHLL